MGLFSIVMLNTPAFFFCWSELFISGAIKNWHSSVSVQLRICRDGFNNCIMEDSCCVRSDSKTFSRLSLGLCVWITLIESDNHCILFWGGLLLICNKHFSSLIMICRRKGRHFPFWSADWDCYKDLNITLNSLVKVHG